MDANVVPVAVLLAVIVKVVLDYIAKPVHSKFPQLDLWWFDWVALACGALVAWFANINLFNPILTNVILGRVLTAFVVGGGAKLINDVFVIWQGGKLPDLGARELTTPVPPKSRYIGW